MSDAETFARLKPIRGFSRTFPKPINDLPITTLMPDNSRT